MTRKMLIVGYILLNACFVAALIGHAAFMFGRVEHTGVMLYAWLAAIAMEGSLVYVTIAQLLARLSGEVPAAALRYAQVGLVIISAYINFRQADGSGNLLDQLVLSVTLPLFLAVNGDVGWLVLRQPQAIETTQVVARSPRSNPATVQPQSLIATVADVEEQSKRNRATVKVATRKQLSQSPAAIKARNYRAKLQQQQDEA